jgi:hypothetical protein
VDRASNAKQVQVLGAEVRDTMHSTNTSHRNPHMPHAVDNADWLKTAAIFSVSVGHFGYFFMEDDRWWSVFGRLAAPIFSSFWASRRPGPSRSTGSGSVSY